MMINQPHAPRLSKRSQVRLRPRAILEMRIQFLIQRDPIFIITWVISKIKVLTLYDEVRYATVKSYAGSDVAALDIRLVIEI